MARAGASRDGTALGELAQEPEAGIPGLGKEAVMEQGAHSGVKLAEELQRALWKSRVLELPQAPSARLHPGGKRKILAGGCHGAA